MPGPSPKDPAARARRNKTSTKAVIRRPNDPLIPKLPSRRGMKTWRVSTRKWWEAFWSSPMATQIDTESEYHIILRYAVLKDAFEEATSEGLVDRMVKISAELRMIEKDYGMTPMPRRTLQWEIDWTQDRNDARNQGREDGGDASAGPGGEAPAEPRERPEDPRLRLVVS